MVIRSKSIIITFTSSQYVFLLSKVFRLTLIIRLWWTNLDVIIIIRCKLSIFLNIILNHNKFHFLEVLISTLYTLAQTLQPFI